MAEFETFDLSALLEEPFKIREEKQAAPNPDLIPLDERREPQAPSQPLEPEKPYDAQANAESLVFGLQAIDHMILTPVAILKVRKNAGGTSTISKMRRAIAKKYEAVELTEEDNKFISLYQDFKNDMKTLTDFVTPSEEDTDRLIRIAVSYCEESRINVGKGMAFWSNYAGSVAERITQILLV